MTNTDTSAEAVRSYLDAREKYLGTTSDKEEIHIVGLPNCENAKITTTDIRALLTELDAAQARAERAEAELQAAVAAEREACAEVCFDYSKDHGTGAFDRHSAECERRIRACANTDALEAVRQETRNEALREAAEACEPFDYDGVSDRMCKTGCQRRILALITEDQSDE